MDAYWVLQKVLARNLIEFLKTSPEIKKVEKLDNYLAVQFVKTGIIEYWRIADGPYRKRFSFDVPYDALSPVKPKLVKQFETNPYYEDEYELLKDHFCIKQSSLKKSGFVNLRFMIHNLTYALHKQGWRDLYYTDDILDHDYDQLIKSGPTKHQSSKIRFEIYRNYEPGRRLLYHFTPIARGAAPAWHSMSRIYTALNYMVAGRKRAITRENLVTALNRITIVPPNYYRAILEECFGNLTNLRILDLYPTSGSRGLAVMLSGGNYFQVKKMFEGPLRQLAARYKLVEPQLDDGSHYDVVFLSRDRPLLCELVEERIGKYGCVANTLLVMASKDDREYLVHKYRPRRVLRISRGVANTADEDNYLLAIDQT